MTYTILSSLTPYLAERKQQVCYLSENIGQRVEFQQQRFQIFLEIGIQDETGRLKNGAVSFKIMFKASKISTTTVLRNTKATIPFFAGLPGFCHKQFMMDQEAGLFAGHYQWESRQSAQQYAGSYAVKAMQWVSAPYPIYFEITDRTTGKLLHTSHQ